MSLVNFTNVSAIVFGTAIVVALVWALDAYSTHRVRKKTERIIAEMERALAIPKDRK